MWWGMIAMAGLMADAPDTSWRQFGWWTPWTDVKVSGEWRAQRHALEGTGRVLDPAGKEVFRGAARDAVADLRRREADGQAPAPTGRVVLFLHGICRNRNSMKGICKAVGTATGATCFAVDYASTHRPLAEHGAAVRELLANMPGAERIDIVCHSMGGLVTRMALGTDPDPRVKRVVMLGTPNLGAEKADFFGDWKLFQHIFGPAGQELKTARMMERVPALPASVEFGVIAGGLENRLGGFGISPFLPRDNDGVVSVDCAKLPGMKDFLVVPAQHTLLMSSTAVREATLRFLDAGKFAAP